MDLSIGASDFHLSLHPSYCAEDDGSILQAVSKYKPFIDWLSRYQPDTHRISRIIVRSIQWIAKRIASLAVDVELQNSSDHTQKMVEACAFADDAQTVLLPILSINGHKYGVLISQPRLAMGGLVTSEALIGTVSKDGFVGLGAEELARAGFKLGAADLLALKNTPLSFGEGGLYAQSIVTAHHALSPNDADGLINGLPVADSNGAVLTAVPLGSIAATSTDLKALTAASLALAA